MEQEYIHDIPFEEYIQFLVDKSTEKLESQVTSVDQFQEYFPNIRFTDQPWDEIEETLTNIYNEIMDTAVTISKGVVNQWTFEKAKSRYNGKLILPKTDLVPTYVIDQHTDKHFLHTFSEELVLGILSVTPVLDRFYFAPKDILDFYNEKGRSYNFMDLNDVLPNFTVKTSGRFHATLSFGNIYFDSIDVITGIITGAQWLNLNPHSYISNITDNGVPVIF